MAYTTIDNPEAYFQVKLYTGNGSTQTITLDNTDADLDPDLIIVKKRSGTHDSVVVDTVRGVTKVIETSTTDAEATWTNGITAISTDSFALGDSGANNDNTETFVAWCWKETATAGFDITTWTGNATNRTISHNLSVAPRVLIIKNTSTTNNWFVYHESMGNNSYMHLETTNGGLSPSTNQFQATSPTSSVFSIGTADGVNKNTSTIICYTFAPVQGFSKFDSYTGNGETDGTFVYTGFRPAWVMIKGTNTNGWLVIDNKRTAYNSDSKFLYPNSNDAEESLSDRFDFLSNGFKLRNTWTAFNSSGQEYIYMAFAEAPFVNSNGVPCNAR